MPDNLGLIINIMLLMGVLVAIGYFMTARKRAVNPTRFQPSIGVAASPEAPTYSDDIISVRHIVQEDVFDDEQNVPEQRLMKKTTLKSSQHRLKPQPAPRLVQKETSEVSPSDVPLMMFLLAKENRQFAGYELLQTVLSVGLRFGEGQLFHRHQYASGQGPVLCSLASATASGVFDLQNIGAFSVRGLCLYMHASKNPNIDAERFSIMLETAKQLSEGLDAYLLDDQRKPLTEERIGRYHKKLNIEQSELELEA